MKFKKPSDWVTLEKNKETNSLADCFAPAAYIQTFFQAISYPAAAIVTGIGAVITKNK